MIANKYRKIKLILPRKQAEFLKHLQKKATSEMLMLAIIGHFDSSNSV